MPVNTAALKSFAPAMRRKLLEAVGRKLDLLLLSQTPDTLSTYARQIAELREQEAQNREQLLERVAYTWFNRLCALRYLDARGWHPFGCKVLMPAGESETQPELLKLMRARSLPAGLKEYTNETRLHGLLDGQIPTAIAGADSQGEVYRELILASCRSYHHLLPNLFEALDDATELLLPDDLLTEGSIAGGFRREISAEDCQNVEIIGWLYQFYISEKKEQVIGKVVNNEDIPAATQFFTPNWIVKYMVQNSLGATWLATYPDSPLKGEMEFYIEPAEQTPEVQSQLAAITPESLDPEALTLIDPACGSGHILVEAYELLKAIYLERGYRQRDIPELILNKNLYGLDICPRAAQLTAFSLLMKGREDDRRLLERGIQVNVMAMKDSKDFDAEGLAQQIKVSDYGLQLNDLTELKCLFKHATTFGSLIQVPEGFANKLPALKKLSEVASQSFIVSQELNHLGPLVRQAELLAGQYDAVVANPPYMGSGGMNALVKTFAKDYFSDAKSDLFACFIERSYLLAKKVGQIAMVTMQNWMFLSSFQKMRERILREKVITSMAQIGYNSFPSMNSKVAQATVFSLAQQKIPGFVGTYTNLNRAPQSADKREVFLERDPANRFDVAESEFARIPGSPIAYWVSDRVREVFEASDSLGSIGSPTHGVVTGDNDRFLRMWSEVSKECICFSAQNRERAVESGIRWFPVSKGGPFRRWFGNNELVIDWKNDGAELRTTKHDSGRIRATNFNLNRIFQPGITWSTITSGSLSMRYSPPGMIFESKGSVCFSENESQRLYLLALTNTSVINKLLLILSPTLDYHEGPMSRLPVVSLETDRPIELAQRCRKQAENDWNAYERSWNFQSPPLLTASTDSAPTIESCYCAWIIQNKSTIAEMKRLEEENNRLFINAYGLHYELTPDVPIDQITLTANPAYRYGGDLNEEERWNRFQRDTMAELLSYAIGCMMGRYSLNQPGLILADSRNNQEEQLAAYEAKVGEPICDIHFQPEPDAIIPLLDSEWFEDDIVARIRKFLNVALPGSSIADNLRFIEESLGKDIRKYFCSEFYKDHLQTYKKRPIYWMVQSPKKGFACLIYLHRYTKDTLNQVLNNYFRPYLQKLEARLAQLGLDQLNDALPTRERTAARKEAEKIAKVLKECQAWEQDALLPIAQQRIELDLDDGVKLNYLKLQDVLAPIPGLVTKED